MGEVKHLSKHFAARRRFLSSTRAHAHSTSKLAKVKEIVASIMMRRQNNMMEFNFFQCVRDAEKKRTIVDLNFDSSVKNF